MHFSTLKNGQKPATFFDVLNDVRQASHPAKLISFPRSADSWAINRGVSRRKKLAGWDEMPWVFGRISCSNLWHERAKKFWTQLVGCLVNWLIWQAKSVVSMVREKFLEFSPYWRHYTHISKGTCREYQFILEFWCQNLCNKSSWLLSFSSSSTPKSTFSIYIYITFGYSLGSITTFLRKTVTFLRHPAAPAGSARPKAAGTIPGRIT